MVKLAHTENPHAPTSLPPGATRAEPDAPRPAPPCLTSISPSSEQPPESGQPQRRQRRGGLRFSARLPSLPHLLPQPRRTLEPPLPQPPVPPPASVLGPAHVAPTPTPKAGRAASPSTPPCACARLVGAAGLRLPGSLALAGAPCSNPRSRSGVGPAAGSRRPRTRAGPALAPFRPAPTVAPAVESPGTQNTHLSPLSSPTSLHGGAIDGEIPST
jgi:hypothetical protein